MLGKTLPTELHSPSQCVILDDPVKEKWALLKTVGGYYTNPLSNSKLGVGVLLLSHSADGNTDELIEQGMVVQITLSP